MLIMLNKKKAAGATGVLIGNIMTGRITKVSKTSPQNSLKMRMKMSMINNTYIYT